MQAGDIIIDTCPTRGNKYFYGGAINGPCFAHGTDPDTVERDAITAYERYTGQPYTRPVWRKLTATA